MPPTSIPLIVIPFMIMRVGWRRAVAAESAVSDESAGEPAESAAVPVSAASAAELPVPAVFAVSSISEDSAVPEESVPTAAYAFAGHALNAAVTAMAAERMGSVTDTAVLCNFS